jgi:hypothetical protein
MPIIKARPNRVQTVRHISRLQEPNRDAPVLYAGFIDDSADYVINQLVQTTLAKDRELGPRRWGSTGPTSAGSSRTRSSIRRAGA